MLISLVKIVIIVEIIIYICVNHVLREPFPGTLGGIGTTRELHDSTLSGNHFREPFFREVFPGSVRFAFVGIVRIFNGLNRLIDEMNRLLILLNHQLIN